MSDTGRQSVTDKVTAAVKPDSEKSTSEHAGDKMKGGYESVAGKAQPESQKSTTQQATDTLTGKGSSDKTWTESAKETLGLGGNKH